MHEQKFQGKLEVIVSAVFTAAGVIMLFYLIPSQILDPSDVIPNAKTFPYVLGAALTLLCFKWFIQSCITLKKQGAAAISYRSLASGIVIGGIFYLLGMLIGSIGYLIGGFLTVFSVILVIEGKHRWRLALLGATAITLTFSLFFQKLLHIEIPAGIFSLFG